MDWRDRRTWEANASRECSKDGWPGCQEADGWDVRKPPQQAPRTCWSSLEVCTSKDAYMWAELAVRLALTQTG